MCQGWWWRLRVPGYRNVRRMGMGVCSRWASQLLLLLLVLVDTACTGGDSGQKSSEEELVEIDEQEEMVEEPLLVVEEELVMVREAVMERIRRDKDDSTRLSVKETFVPRKSSRI
ncbi:uncharacterized protein LOC121859433 isoform X2 [Homarus americanus]|uniref:uncharacterized protein LOC121859433 isoform X2 n=1 Tax=Homarus americanus TaxID=6706 RepID=UPI001C443081|nr:uncharacterized protein LOC121859433 isoform X2 [Homarus americanus]